MAKVKFVVQCLIIIVISIVVACKIKGVDTGDFGVFIYDSVTNKK